MGFHRNSTISYYLNEGKKKHIFKEGMYIHIQNHWFNKGKNHSKFLKNQYHYIAGYTGKKYISKEEIHVHIHIQTIQRSQKQYISMKGKIYIL